MKQKDGEDSDLTNSLILDSQFLSEGTHSPIAVFSDENWESRINELVRSEFFFVFLTGLCVFVFLTMSRLCTSGSGCREKLGMYRLIFQDQARSHMIVATEANIIAQAG